MRIEGVGDHEAADIDRIVDRLLRELGNPEPPLSLEVVRDALKIDLKYYNTAEPSLLDEIGHKVTVGVKQLLLRPGLIVDAVKKANLSAIWMPDTKRILIDEAIPKLKHRWIEGHEVGHSLIPWHREFMFGDTEYTLDPTCHEMVEAEANYAAAQLLFLRGRFAAEARDSDLGFKQIKGLAKRYGNTITTSLWRTIQERDPETPVFGLVSRHPRYPEIGSGPNGEDVRYYIRSSAFRSQFSNVSEAAAFELVCREASWARKGTIVDCTQHVTDVNGSEWEFRIESFSNGYALLTYGTLVGPRLRLLAVA